MSPLPPKILWTKILWTRIRKKERKKIYVNIWDKVIFITWTIFGIYTDLLRIPSL